MNSLIFVRIDNCVFITYTSAMFFQRIQQPDSVSLSVLRMYTLLVSVPTYIHSEPYVQEMAVGLCYAYAFGSGRELWSNYMPWSRKMIH